MTEQERPRRSGLRGFGHDGPSPWTDLDRPPLDGAALSRDLVLPGVLWTALDVVTETGSTNTDLTARAREGAPEGAVLIAERQNAGRGRLDRQWSAPARSGLFLSMLLRPTVPRERLGWLPILVGVAAAGAISRIGEVEVTLKWPNDLQVTVDGAERKVGGILTELTGDAVVAGLGLNVTLRAEELPVPTAASLLLAGAEVTDRDTLLRALLRAFAELYGEWQAAAGDPHASGLLPAYTARCSTLGREVLVQLPGSANCAARRSRSTATAAWWSALRTAPGSRWQPATSCTSARSRPPRTAPDAPLSGPDAPDRTIPCDHSTWQRCEARHCRCDGALPGSRTGPRGKCDDRTGTDRWQTTTAGSRRTTARTPVPGPNALATPTMTAPSRSTWSG